MNAALFAALPRPVRGTRQQCFGWVDAALQVCVGLSPRGYFYHYVLGIADFDCYLRFFHQRVCVALTLTTQCPPLCSFDGKRRAWGCGLHQMLGTQGGGHIAQTSTQTVPTRNILQQFLSVSFFSNSLCSCSDPRRWWSTGVLPR